MESLLVEEFPKYKEHSQAKILETLKIHVVEDASKEEPCVVSRMRRALELKESEHLECSKVKESELEKMSFQGLQVGVNMEQAIQDWLISKSAFEEKSFHGLAIIYRKYIKEFSTNASNVLCLDKKINIKLIKYIHSKNHNIVNANNKKFGMKLCDFDPRG
ncbi:hypothetical protein M9H77_30855 [Catharanthus roseus]|uniref:Uncharacterized protein n=1 Tax=Catharanthus roseus TaxID=4058 RepID=A0ACB9ZYE4_CATRO|nr:hypothetical protein M9H77_30855 [Catharanthus roseus]